MTPKPVWNPDVANPLDFRAQWAEVPDNETFDNGFKTQWEQFLRHVVHGDPWSYDFLSAARGGNWPSWACAPPPTARGSPCPSWPCRDRPCDRHRRAGAARGGRPAGAVPMLARPLPTAAGPPARSRIAYAAAHVVADPLADNTPGRRPGWTGTPRWSSGTNLWRHGLGVADAMDTAQRGMGLDWAATAELVRRSAAEAASVGGALVCGAGTDQLPPGEHDLAAVLHAYEEQLEVLEDAGAGVVLMASRALAASAAGPADYAKVYGALLDQVRRPVLLHWLGPMFEPRARRLLGSPDLDAATDAFLQIIAAHPDKVDGVKVSLLDADREVALRRRLPEGVRCYTGDDFHYPELILGDGTGTATPCSVCSTRLRRPPRRRWPRWTPATRTATGGSSRRPCRWPGWCSPSRPSLQDRDRVPGLAGRHQTHFSMVSGMQSARSLPHLGQLFVLADRAGLLPDPDLAAARMRALLAVAGL